MSHQRTPGDVEIVANRAYAPSRLDDAVTALHEAASAYLQAREYRTSKRAALRCFAGVLWSRLAFGWYWR